MRISEILFRRKKILRSSENHPRNVPLPTPKMHWEYCYAIFQPSIPEPWQICLYTTLYTKNLRYHITKSPPPMSTAALLLPDLVNGWTTWLTDWRMVEEWKRCSPRPSLWRWRRRCVRSIPRHDKRRCPRAVSQRAESFSGISKPFAMVFVRVLLTYTRNRL